MIKSIDRMYEICTNFHVLLKIQAAMVNLENLVLSIDSNGKVRIDPTNCVHGEDFCLKVIDEKTKGIDRPLNFEEAILVLIELEKAFRRD